MEARGKEEDGTRETEKAEGLREGNAHELEGGVAMGKIRRWKRGGRRWKIEGERQSTQR